MQKISAAFVKAQSLRGSPEGRMQEANLIRKILPRNKGRNQATAKTGVDRLMSHVAFGASDCWYFVGAQDSGGYGSLPYLGENKAHRVSYRLFFGDIPHGMKVMHRCDTRCCVNPNHLTLGTQADNVADMVLKGRNKSVGLSGIRNPMAKLTAEAVSEIRRRVAAGEKQINLVREFNVSPMTVSRVVRGEAWK